MKKETWWRKREASLQYCIKCYYILVINIEKIKRITIIFITYKCGIHFFNNSIIVSVWVCFVPILVNTTYLSILLTIKNLNNHFLIFFHIQNSFNFTVIFFFIKISSLQCLLPHVGWTDPRRWSNLGSFLHIWGVRPRERIYDYCR